MLKELETNFSLLEKKIDEVRLNHKNLLEKYAILADDYNQLKAKYEEEHKQNQELVEEQKKIKLISAISGNPDHNRLMKNHINRLVKEIDSCIAQLQNSGL
jgi:predicted nuclease with TOPRIM domain